MLSSTKEATLIGLRVLIDCYTFKVVEEFVCLSINRGAHEKSNT